MIVVSDTSPLNYLILIELPDILPKLFDRILIPEAVRRELLSPAAPDAVKRFLAAAPDWLEARPSPDVDPALRQLDSGEREAISLAVASSAVEAPCVRAAQRATGWPRREAPAPAPPAQHRYPAAQSV